MTAQLKSTDEWREVLSGNPRAAAAELAKAAAEGVIDAQLAYGQCLLDGYGVETDQAAALDWFMRAAKSGHPMGMNMVGRCCELGWGTRIDKSLAAQWYGAAADAGLDWAMYNLATLYSLGEGVACDRVNALRLFQQAAALGHVKSVNMIGSFYEDGWEVEADLAIAAEHYRRAAEGGDFRGQFNHARMLLAAGESAEASSWLDRVHETAPPAFIEKMKAWLTENAKPLAEGA